MVLLWLVVSLATPVLAQEQPTQTPTATPEEPETRLLIGDVARVTDWNYNNGTFTIEIHADRKTTVTIAESVAERDSGSGYGTMKQRPLAKGKNVVKITVADVSGAAVTIAPPMTGGSAEFVYLKRGSKTQLIPQGPYSSQDLYAGSVGVFLAVTFTVLYRAARAKLGAFSGGERLA